MSLHPQIDSLIHTARRKGLSLELENLSSPLLFLAICDNEDSPAISVLERIGIMRSELQEAFSRRLKITASPTTTPGALPLSHEVERILRLMLLEVRFQKANEATDLHLLLATLRDKNNEAAQVLQEFDLNYKKIISHLQLENSTRHPEGGLGFADDERRPNTNDHKANSKATQQDQETPIIDNYGTDLTQAAAEGLLDPIVGRHLEVERMAQILSRRKKNNPILIGEPGVGKSALVEGLAQLIVAKQVPHLLRNKRLVALDMASIVAGTQYRGQFEERLRRLIEELRDHKEIILFIDEIHTIIGAGSAPGSLDAANILKPALARGEVQCIGATTIAEFKKTIEKDGALDRRFQKIQLEPTTAADTLHILNNIKERYEDHHNVRYTDAALEACVHLTERYISDRALPDKAIDALDEAGSRVHLLHVQQPETLNAHERDVANLRTLKDAAAARQEYELAAQLRDQLQQAEAQLQNAQAQWQEEIKQHRIVVDLEDIASVVSMMSGVPAERMQEAENVRLRGMKQALSAKVVAQDRAITKLTRAITRNRLGLKDPNRPIGTFMFVGPTGVGKTHLVKTLAEFMFGRKDALIRIDMSEYGEKFSTSRLVGAPPGYVGYEEGGQLTEQVRRHPYSIILLDEIEKAHPDVFNTLLQVLDEGRMTDGNGTTVDFRNTIIILTSNSGSRQIKEFGAGIGFATPRDGISAEAAEGIVRKALQRQFAPEFLNRLDEIIMFDPLTRESVSQIAKIELKALGQRLSHSGYQLELSASAEDFLAQKGFDPHFGARALRRALQDHLEDPVCDRILEGETGTHIQVDATPEAESLTIQLR